MIPKAASTANQVANFNSLSLKLTEEEVAELTKNLDADRRMYKTVPNMGVDSIFA